MKLKSSYVGPRYRVLMQSSVSGSELMCKKLWLTEEHCLVLSAHEYVKCLLHMLVC